MQCLQAQGHEPRANAQAEKQLQQEINALMRKAEIPLVPRKTSATQGASWQ